MKKVLFIAVAASVAFAACTKNEVRSVESQQDRQITFQAVVNKASTKAGNDNTFTNNAVYPLSSTFGTFAYFYTTSFTTGATPSDTYINNAEVKHKNGVESNTSSPANGWTTDTPYYWPKQGKLTFYSYSPYSINTGDNVSCDITATDAAAGGVIIKSWDVDANQKTDIMIADRKDGQTTNTSNSTTGWNGVPTIFRHKLAQVVDFTLNTTQDYANLSSGENPQPQAGSKLFFINKIAIHNVVTNGKFVSGLKPGNEESDNKGTWTNLESGSKSNDYIWFEQDDCISTATEGKSINQFTYVAESGTKFSCPKNGKYDGSETGDFYDIASNNFLLVRPQTFTAISGWTNGMTYTTPDASSTDSYIELVYTIRSYSATDKYVDEKVHVYADLNKLSNSWEINKRYTYNITISLDQIYWDPSVFDWEDGTTTNITI